MPTKILARIRFPRLAGALAAIALLGAASTARANYLYNPGFETPDPNISSGFIDHGSANASWFAGWGTAAQDWPATSNDLNYGAIATWLTPNVVHGGATSMLVTATTTNGGVGQQYMPNGPTPLHQRFGVWLYVVAGQVTIGLGNASTGFATAYSDPAKTNQWQYVSVCAPPTRNIYSNTNQVVLYTTNGKPAIFYADDADVSTPALFGNYLCP